MGPSTEIMQNTKRRVQVLSADVAEKIAAGEVIERPFSVVKELVENSLDAGASSITVELENGGLRRIAVTDNGLGMQDEDVLTALERHATSKIISAEDLWALSTLGFRGEALPSMAAISHFTIETRSTGENGRCVSVEGGKLKTNLVLPANAAVPLPSGTRVSAEHMFFNVPARLKFLKSKSSESAAVRDLLERLALCRPEVSFTLISEGRRTLHLPATDLLDERLAAILDCSVQSLEAIGGAYAEITVRGLVDRDGRAANSKQVYLAVNGRMVKDKLLQQAVMVAMRPIMMEGEYPRLFLEVTIPPGDIDVNVHPNKTEVRFVKPRDVFQVISIALSSLTRQSTRIAYEARPNFTQPPAPVLFDRDRTVFRTKYEPLLTPTPAYEQNSEQTPQSIEPTTADDQSFALPSKTQNNFFALQYLGQLKNTYLLFQDEQGLVLIDQHAAHERINYERLKNKLLESGLKAQPLLIGVTLKLSADDIALALDHSVTLARFGFEAEAFGDQHLIIRAAPVGLDDKRVMETFHGLLTTLRDLDDAPASFDPTKLSPKIERAIATAACHGSIRAGQPLSRDEAIALVSTMEETPSALNCPHGRPASIRLSFNQVEGLFQR